MAADPVWYGNAQAKGTRAGSGASEGDGDISAQQEGKHSVRLSREKINHISQLIIKELAESDAIEFLREPNEVRLEIVKLITDELRIDDEIDEQVRKTLNSYSRTIVEGSREWEVMYNKLYDEEFNKRGRF